MLHYLTTNYVYKIKKWASCEADLFNLYVIGHFNILIENEGEFTRIQSAGTNKRTEEQRMKKTISNIVLRSQNWSLFRSQFGDCVKYSNCIKVSVNKLSIYWIMSWV